MRELTELCRLIERHAKPDDPLTALSGVRLVTAVAPLPPISSIYEPCLGIVAQGGKRTIVGEKIFEYSGGEYLVVPVDLPIAGQITKASEHEPYLAMSVTLKPHVIADLILEPETENMTTREMTGMVVETAKPELLDPLVRLLRLLDAPNDVPVLLPIIERELIWRLLNGRHGSTVRQIGLTDSRLSQIARAIRWLCKHYSEPVKIEKLAYLADMSLSSFHRHFRAVTAMSPLQYQKQVRLQEARNRLIAGAEDAATVSFAVGYQSPSQFNREYSRLFGTPPRRDVSKFRSNS